MNNHQEFLEQCVNAFAKQSRYKNDLTFFIRQIDGNFLIHSDKQDLQYRLGFYNQELFISVPIYKPCYPVFRLMNDEFWFKILEINQFAKFKFFQNVPFDDCIQSEFNKMQSKSSIFELIKVFVLMEEYQKYSVDMGNFEVIFNTEKSNKELIGDVVNALNILYFLNKELAKKCTPQFISKNYLCGYY